MLYSVCFYISLSVPLYDEHNKYSKADEVTGTVKVDELFSLLCRRFVDDVFAIIKKKDSCPDYVKQFGA